MRRSTCCRREALCRLHASSLLRHLCRAAGSSSEEEEEGVGRGAGPAAAGAAAVRLELQPVGEDAVAVRLVLLSLQGAGAPLDDEAEVEADSSYAASSSSSGSESGGESGDEAEDGPLDVIENYADLKKMIDDMDAAPAEPAELDDDEEGGGGGGGGGAHRAEAELLGSVPLPSLAALEIGADEAVQAAGTVQSMLEGMVVIKVGGPAWEVGRGPRSGAGSLGAAAGTAGVAAHTGGRGTAPYPSSIAARASLHRSFAGLGPARPRHVRRCCLQARPHRVCVTPCPLPAGAGRQPRPERGLRAGAGGSHTHRLRGGDLWPG